MDNSPKIEIYVSHRIDLNSQLVNNPLYKNMRCGAVFDDKNPMNIAGDDTGDNISERRMSFCEFTVQYWAWKNSDADYIGLCHYRRYLSFAEKRYKLNEFGLIPIFLLTEKQMKKFGLLDSEKMAETIRQYDLLIPEPARMEYYPTPKGKVKNIRELWEANDNHLIKSEVLDKLLSLIDELSPEYSISAREYFAGDRHFGYNCYVMRRDLFCKLCEFQFPILFAVEEWVKTRSYAGDFPRIPGYAGEILYGIFVYHEEKNRDVRIKQLQLILVRDSDRIKSTANMIWRSVKGRLELIPRALINLFFPIGSTRREKLKNIYYAITRKNKRAIAQILEEKSCKR